MPVEKNEIPLKDRMKMPRVLMPEIDYQTRITTFAEVGLGLSVESATIEASRCIECGKPGCIMQCPVGIDIKSVVSLIRAGDYLAAAAKIREKNSLPAVTSRVCPQENQCEGGCALGKKGESLAIGNLERFIADFERSTGQLGLPSNAPPTGKSVAIVGSGPAGLAIAGDLVQKGHRVRVFEALHELGGVLLYGIPEFRLPKAIVREEVENLRKMGVEFETNVLVGKTVTIDELMRLDGIGAGFDAVFIAIGAGKPLIMGIPGEALNGVCTSSEFLARVNLMRGYQFPNTDDLLARCRDKDVIVVGGGNTAMDTVRTAKRLGARSVTLVYRRTQAEMPACHDEIHHTKAEGIEFRMLTNPVEFLGDGEGRLTGVRCLRMELGEPDASGRRSPAPVSGSEHDLPADVAIVGLGTTANPLIPSTTPDLKTDRKGFILADPKTMRTSKRGVFAGGDVVTGGATVVLAMRAGRQAAAAIDDFLRTGEWN